VVPAARVRLPGQQQRDDIGMAGCRCAVQRRVAAHIADVDHRPALDQGFDGPQRSRHRSPGQRGLSVQIQGIRLGPGIQQALHERRIGLHRRSMQRRFAVARATTWVAAAGDQDAQHLELTLVSGDEQGQLPLGITGREVDAALAELLDALHVAALDGLEQLHRLHARSRGRGRNLSPQCRRRQQAQDEKAGRCEPTAGIRATCGTDAVDSNRCCRARPADDLHVRILPVGHLRTGRRHLPHVLAHNRHNRDNSGMQMTADKVDYDLLYNPRLTVADAPAFIERWRSSSARTRAQLDGYLDVPYGAAATERMDIFRARGHSKGLLMFIHGGYWRAFGKAEFSFIARPYTDAGITVAVPGYALCPSVQVRDIVMQMVQAAAWLHRNGRHFGAPAGQLHVSGHSAGGQLAAMLLACRWRAYAADLPDKVVAAALSISGLYDLRDVARAQSINADVRLDAESALQASPAFLPPATDAPLTTAVGAEENAGFHIQNRLIARRWRAVLREDIACPGDNHFSVLDRFADPGSALFAASLRMMGA
jgi:arylformamidase